MPRTPFPSLPPLLARCVPNPRRKWLRVADTCHTHRVPFPLPQRIPRDVQASGGHTYNTGRVARPNSHVLEPGTSWAVWGGRRGGRRCSPVCWQHRLMLPLPPPLVRVLVRQPVCVRACVHCCEEKCGYYAGFLPHVPHGRRLCVPVVL